jgi:hypothetical protein
MLEMLFEYVKVSEVESEELATALVFLFSQKGRGRNLLEQALRSGMRHCTRLPCFSCPPFAARN